MNYNQRIANAITEYTNHKMPYLSYFKREAIKAYKADNEEFEDFFNSCGYIISLFKNEIISQFNKDLDEEKKCILECKKKLKSGILNDYEVSSIKNKINTIKDEMDEIYKEGYKDSFKYKCCIRSDSGQIVENNTTGCLILIDKITREPKYAIHDLYYSDIEVIEEALIKCRNKIIDVSKFKDLTEKPKEHFSDYLINITDKESFIIKIAPLINNQEAKQIAYLLIYLDIEKYILFPKKRTEIYKIMRSDFSIIPTNKSINDYLGKYFSAKEKSLMTKIVVISLFEEFYLKITELDNLKSLMK